MQEALYYSTSKRASLAEKEASRILVKITSYTKIADVTNDITQITAPNSFKCQFQISQELSQQKLSRR